MFAQLGDHIFQGLKTPTSFNESDAAIYGQLSRINGKAAIQPTGAELREVNLTIQYSSDFCDPVNEIAALKKSMRNFEVLPYITGDGRIFGKFVIKSVDTSFQRCAADGIVEMATINVNLLESPGGSEPEPIGEALSSQKPTIATPAKPVPTPATDIASNLAEANSKVSGMKQTIAKIKGRTTSIKRGVREVRQLATDAQTSYATAKTKAEATKKIAQRASQLPTSLDEAIKYAENIAKMDNVMDVSVLEMNVGQLSASSDKVMAHAAPVAGFAGTKEGGN